MFKIIVDMKEVEFDEFIEEVIKSGAIKVPGISASLLKKLPQSTKNEIVVTTFAKEKNKVMNQITQMALQQGVAVQIEDLLLLHAKEPGVEIRAVLHVRTMDYAKANERLLPLLLKEEDFTEVFGEQYDGTVNLQMIVEHLKTEPQKQQEYIMLKTLSRKKQMIKEVIEEYVASKKAKITISSIRFFMD